MKLVKSVTSLFILATLALAVVSIPASAQQVVAQAEIPFQFQAAGKVMPAGTYNISLMVRNGLLMVADAEGHVALMLGRQIEPAKANESGRLVFRHAGSNYTLTSLFIAGQSAGYAIPASKKDPADRVEVSLLR